jgi:hypothetical protein
LKADGYQVQLIGANAEATALDLDEWEHVIVEQDGKRFRLKIHDHPAWVGTWSSSDVARGEFTRTFEL